MKSTETFSNYFPDRFQALTADEADSIQGGETLFYWASYGIGIFVHTLMHSSPQQSGGQKLMNVAL